MARYYFDVRDDETLHLDKDGADFTDLEAVKAEAAVALAEIAFDRVPLGIRREMAMEVHDDHNKLILRVVIVFEVCVLADL